MKTSGLIGGMSWESTVTYYRIINEEVKNRLGGLHSAKIILYSVEFDEIEKCQKSIKACSDNLRKALAELDDDESDEEPTDDKTLDIITTVELPDFDN